jgi:hypothetical protein
MNEFLITLLAFTFIIAALLVERHLFIKQVNEEKAKLLDELSRAVKAVIAKNANDYVMTASIDKVAPEEKPPLDPDLVPEESLSDEEFMKAINKDVAKPS